MLATSNTSTNERVNPVKGDRRIVTNQINPANNLPYYFVYKGNGEGQTGNVAANWVNTGETIIGADAANIAELAKKTDMKTIFNVSQYNSNYGYSDSTTARNAVPTALRGYGQIIKYRLSDSRWITEQSTSTAMTDWINPMNWISDPDIANIFDASNAKPHTVSGYSYNIIPIEEGKTYSKMIEAVFCYPVDANGVLISGYNTNSWQPLSTIRRTLQKICDYIMWIILAYTLDKAFISFEIDLLPFIILIVIYGIELESIFKNYFTARGKNIKVNFLKFFGKKTDLIDRRRRKGGRQWQLNKNKYLL